MAIHDWKPDFLAALSLVPNVTAAAVAARVSRTAVYLARDSDPEFREAWTAALEESTDTLVGEMYRRAVQGVHEPVYYKGRVVGSLQKYSDTLAIFLAKAHRRETYGDQVKTDLTSGGDKIQTVFYIPENGRDDPGPTDPEPGPG